jgi:hypothetical protein
MSHTARNFMETQTKKTTEEGQTAVLRSGDLFGQLERLVKQKGRLQISHDEGGSGMAYYWCATLGDEWPYCHASTLEGSLRVLVSEHLRLEREALQKRINEIDGSASL